MFIAIAGVLPGPYSLSINNQIHEKLSVLFPVPISSISDHMPSQRN